MEKKYTIAVAGTGYVGLSIATLLSQNHKVYAVDIIPEKVEMINNRISPINDKYIEKHLAEKELDLTAFLVSKRTYFDLMLEYQQALADYYTSYAELVKEMNIIEVEKEFI